MEERHLLIWLQLRIFCDSKISSTCSTSTVTQEGQKVFLLGLLLVMKAARRLRRMGRTSGQEEGEDAGTRKQLHLLEGNQQEC